MLTKSHTNKQNGSNAERFIRFAKTQLQHELPAVFKKSSNKVQVTHNPNATITIFTRSPYFTFIVTPTGL